MTAFGTLYHRILFGTALDAKQGVIFQFAAALFAFLRHNHTPPFRKPAKPGIPSFFPDSYYTQKKENRKGGCCLRNSPLFVS